MRYCDVCTSIAVNEATVFRSTYWPGIQHQPTFRALAAASSSCPLCQLIHGALIERATHGTQLNSLLEHQNEASTAVTFAFQIAGDIAADLINTVEFRCGDTFPWLTSAEFHVSVEDDDPLAKSFSRRRITKNPRSEVVMRRARQWACNCDRHRRCQEASQAEFPGGRHSLPTRVLQLLDTSDQYCLRLVDGSDHEGRYIALSYCWGTSSPLTTTNETLQARRQGVLFKDLPQTLQDAVTVSRELGATFLWIDALCIVQDDIADWQREAAQMASIYRKSLVTLAASNATESSVGFLKPRNVSYPAKISSRSLTGKSTQMYLQRAPQLRRRMDPLKSEPLMTRGWTLQERFLPVRILHFGSQEMFWECETGLFSENGSLMTRSLGLGDLLDEASEEIGEYVDPKGDAIQYLGWYDMIETYSQRQLTYGTDRLPALSGLADRMSRKFEDKYCAGLWWKDLMMGLFWGSKRFLSQPSSWRAPSWSCVALDGPITFPTWRIVATQIAVFKDCDIALSGEDPRGGIKSATLDLEAPLYAVESMRLVGKSPDSGEENVVELTIDHAMGNRLATGHLDTKDDFGVRASILVLAGGEDESTPGDFAFIGLLVEEIKGGPTQYRRIGTFECEWHFEPGSISLRTVGKEHILLV